MDYVTMLIMARGFLFWNFVVPLDKKARCDIVQSESTCLYIATLYTNKNRVVVTRQTWCVWMNVVWVCVCVCVNECRVRVCMVNCGNVTTAIHAHPVTSILSVFQTNVFIFQTKLFYLLKISIPRVGIKKIICSRKTLQWFFFKWWAFC